MKFRRTLFALTAALGVMTVAGCADGAATAPSPVAASPTTSDGTGPGHGDIEGATEVPDPPLALLSISADGSAGILDLVSGEATDLASIGKPQGLATDGRYGFVTTGDGLTVVDSGRWSWNHGDHFHYYLAEPRVVGVVSGTGPVTVASGMLSTAGGTGLFFAGSGEAVLLENSALADGTLVEQFRIELDQAAGIVAPLGSGALVTVADQLVFYESDGVPTSESTGCTAAAGTITTVVGVVIGCADGAVLASVTNGTVTFEQIPYPDGVAAAHATGFDGRKSRPTAAALAGTDGFWLLDTRERTWQFIATATPLSRVAAVDDKEGHVVAVDVDGRVRVFSADTGSELAVTEPLVSGASESVSLTVDDRRAYVNDPATGSVFEIDFADAARIARTLNPTTAPQWLAEVGR